MGKNDDSHNFKQVRNVLSIIYKKIAAEADKQVIIYSHPLKRKTAPTTIWEKKEEGEKGGNEDNLPISDRIARRSTRTKRKKK